MSSSQQQQQQQPSTSSSSKSKSSPSKQQQDGDDDVDRPPDCPENLELVERLGKGSYGSVYKARDRDTGEVVAAKRIVLPRQDEEGYRAVQREISVLQECKHPNVVRYKASHKLGDRHLWIVMEYCA